MNDSRGDIKSVQAFNENAMDWKFLEGAIPRGGIPCDIDGFLELNHHFLFLEAERADKKRKVGQHLALMRLALLPRVMVLIIEWEPIIMNTRKEIVHIYKIDEPDKVEIIGRSYEDLIELVKEWCAWTERRSTA